MSRSPGGDSALEVGRENGCCRQPNNKAKGLQLLHMTDSQKPLVARCESEGVEITAVRMPGKREHIVNFVSRSRRGAGEDEVRVSDGKYGSRPRRCPPNCLKSMLCATVLILVIITLILTTLLVKTTCTDYFHNPINSTVGNTDVPSPLPNRTSPAPTMSGALWENFRLPTHLRPSHYILSLRTDIERDVFTGDITIHFECRESTPYIILHTKELNYSDDSFRFVVESGNDIVTLDKGPKFYEKNDFMVLKTSSPMREGNTYALSMRYQAFFNPSLLGLYQSKYTTSTGETEHVVASFMSPTNARRVFPCFDEPAFKANFTVSLVHPHNYTALSNMDVDPERTRRSMTTEGGWTTTWFRTTPVMSTYLIAFAVCKFESKQTMVRNDVKFRVWARPEVIQHTSFALEVGVNLFNFLEDFSGFGYPLPKLDMIALPQLVPGGMENWGLLTYREDFMLYDRDETPTESLQLITFVIAHELGHQWYSNLVTQVFWDELWLKEAFATIMGKIALEVLYPDWALYDEQFVLKDLQSVMKLDSLVTSHPIQQPVLQGGDIIDNFDLISYDKSAAVIRMLEHSIGYDLFRDGLALFLQNKQYGNADAWDIWSAITKVMPANSPNRNISAIMAPWLGQMGYPVVTVTRDCGHPDRVCVQQDHFILDEGNVSSVPESKYGYIWPTPVTYTTSSNNDIISPDTYWLTSHTGSFGVSGLSNDQWLLVNINRTGFFRTNYDHDTWRLLCDQLLEDHMVFSSGSRAVLIDDVFSFASEGRLSLSLALDLTTYLRAETVFVPWKATFFIFQYFDQMLRTTPVYGIFKEYIKHQATTVYDFVGWENSGPHQQKLLRVLILGVMCGYGLEECFDQVETRYGNISDNQPIPPDFRSIVYSTRVASGGLDTWEATWEAYKTGSPAEAQHRLAALTATGEPWLLNRLLSRTLDPEQLSLTDTVTVFQHVSKSPIGGYLAWNFFRDQWELLKERYASGLFQLPQIIDAVTGWFNTRYQLEELEAFIANKKEDLRNLAGYSSFEQAVANTKTNIRWMENNYQHFEEWLENWNTNMR